MTKICILPKVHGTGGMVSFKHKFSAGLATRGIAVTDDPEDSYDAMLVISGTRHLSDLNRARKRGIRVVQRLDGINWIQRRRRTSLKYFFRAETGNILLALIRARYADRLIYQSHFVRDWWSRWYGQKQKPFSVFYNGVDLSIYTPEGAAERPTERYRLLVVEGSLTGGMSVGLDMAVELAAGLQRQYSLPMELMVVGQVEDSRQQDVDAQVDFPVIFLGLVPREQIPGLDRSAHLYFSADINAACPNAAIEAMACGLPVTGFATGALPELVSENAGKVAPYGSDPWKLQKPDVPALVYAAASILSDLPAFQRGARQRALEAFGLDTMVDHYLEALLGK